MGDLIGTEQAGHATEEATSGSVTSGLERLPQPRLPVSDAIRLPAFMMSCPSGSENISRWDLVKAPPTASIAGQQNLQVDAGVEQDTLVGPDRQDPNSAMSASHPAPPAQAVSSADATVTSTAQGSQDDIDENWKRRGAAVKSSSAGPRQWMPVASSLYPCPSSSSSKLSFLDKVESHPAAPRSVAISPYGSAHPLHFTAKKYLLRVGLPSSSTDADTDKAAPATASQSRATKAASEQEQEREQETESEQAEPVKEAYKASVTDLQEVEDSFRAPSLSRLSPVPPLADTEEEDMGSRAAYARSQTRKQRRPSPLDLPAAKRRRSSSGPVSVVKVEETEDETSFLISRKEPLRPSSTTSRLPAPSRQSVSASLVFPEMDLTADTVSSQPAPTQQTLPTTPFSAATEKQRAASPASSVDLRSTLADEDCSCLDNELRTPTLRVPLYLPRPDTVKDFDLASLELDESLRGVPMPYILDNIALRGPLLLSSVVDSSIALPSTSTLASSPSSGPAIPSSVAVRTPTRLAQDSALPEYALAVSSDDTHQVMFLPVHGLVLATNCKTFAGIARPPPVELQSSEEGEDTIRILPVVHIHLPSSVSFSKLIPFFYTNEAGSLLNSLLPIHELPQLSLSASQKSPALLASHLAKLDQSILAQYIHFNHSTWKTAVALGAGKDELWTVLQGAWNALIAALSIQHKQSLRPKVEQDRSEITA